MIVALQATTACSGGGNGGSNTVPPTGATPPPVITESYTFPSGDATATAGTAWDIVGLKTTLSGQYGDANGNSYDTLRVDVTFAQDISGALPAPGQQLLTGNQLGVQIFIDADGNPATGSNATCNASSKLRPFEFLTDQGDDPYRLPDGNYSILGIGGAQTTEVSGPAGEAITDVNGHVLSETFFLTVFGVFDEARIPKIGVAADAFNGATISGTDCVPKANLVELFTSE
jgi:hypothetical protein